MLTVTLRTSQNVSSADYQAGPFENLKPDTAGSLTFDIYGESRGNGSVSGVGGAGAQVWNITTCLLGIKGWGDSDVLAVIVVRR